MPIGQLTSAINPTGSTNLTTFTILVDGSALSADMSVVAITLRNTINSIPTAQIIVEDGDAAQATFASSSADELVPGKTIEIKGGYNSNEDSLFKGVITEQQIKVRGTGGSFLKVECKDQFFKTTLDRKSRYYSNVSDADIYSEIAGQYDGLSASVDILGVANQYAEITQYKLSDWDFIMLRIEKSGTFSVLDNGELRVYQLPKLDLPAAFSLEYGRNIFDLDLRLNARTQYRSVTASSWDDSQQGLLSGNSSSVDVISPGNLSNSDLADISQSDAQLSHSGNLSQEALDEWAASQLQKSHMAKVRGTIKFQGNVAAQPGAMVELAGLGDRFNGQAFISGVEHSLGRGDWLTTIQIGFDPEWHYERFNLTPPPAAGFATPVDGLQIGIVTQLADDPDGRERIQVRLPLVDSEQQGNWMRWASLDAGAERGFVFRPEIGDEVIVGFIQQDPNQAVVLGMLHSSEKIAPIEASDDNHEKGYVSRENLKLSFNDEIKSITLESPNGNSILLSEEEKGIIIEDENSNKITLNADGITIESSKDLILKATGDVKVEGTNIEQAANASFKAEGSAGAELSSSANTVVKGSLVQIN